MKDLVGRLDVLDPGASHSLKVIAYFDALVEGHASPEMLVRGAAFLSGVAAGLDGERGRVAVDERGTRRLDAAPASFPTHSVPGGGVVWIERSGEKHSNDDMILERLAIGVGITLDRSAPQAAIRRAVETVIDDRESRDARREASARLRLDPAGRYRVVAQPALGAGMEGHHTTVVTHVGAIRAVLVPSDNARFDTRSGIGLEVTPDHLPESWASALTALRLTSDSEPVISAADLGSLLLLADAADLGRTSSPDAAALHLLLDTSPRLLAQLEAVARSESLRSAATSLGIHHSTLQARIADTGDALGFDIRTPAGMLRLQLALALHRLDVNHFD